METYNTTMTAIDLGQAWQQAGYKGISSMSIVTPLVAGLVFLILVISLFMFFKYFRSFIYGLSCLIPIGILSLISWNIAKPMEQGNYVPYLRFCAFVTIVVVSIIVGKIVEKIPIVKQIEKSFTVNTKTKRR